MVLSSTLFPCAACCPVQRNILEDPRVRMVLSGWSDWPTIPQLFVDGTLVGGCDIVTELYQDGELQKMVPA